MLMSSPTRSPKSLASRQPGKLTLGSGDALGDSCEGAAKMPRGVGKLTSQSGKLGSADPKDQALGGLGVENEDIGGAHPGVNLTESIKPGNQAYNSDRGSESGDRAGLTMDTDSAVDIVEAGADPREVGKLKMTTSGSPKSPRRRKTGKLPHGSVDAFEDSTYCGSKLPRKSNSDPACPDSLSPKSWKNRQIGGNLAGSTDTGYPTLASQEGSEVNEEASTNGSDNSDAVDNVEDESRGSRGVGKLIGVSTASPNSPRQRKAGKLPTGYVDVFEGPNQQNRGRRLSKSLEGDSDTSNPRSSECFGDTSTASHNPTIANTHGSSSCWAGPDGMSSSEKPEMGEDCEGRSIGKLNATGEVDGSGYSPKTRSVGKLSFDEDDGSGYSPKTRSVGKLSFDNIGCFEKEDTRRTPGKIGTSSFASSPMGNDRRGQNTPRNALSPQPVTDSASLDTHLSPNKLPSGATECFDSPQRRLPSGLKSADHLPPEATDCFENPVPTPARRPVRSSPGKLRSFAIRAFTPRTPSQENLPPAFSVTTPPRRKWTPPRRPVAVVTDVSENDET